MVGAADIGAFGSKVRANACAPSVKGFGFE
jgi:hypothetical protein